MKAMMTAMMTAAIKGCLFIFLPSACLQGPQDLGSGVPGPPGLGEERDNLLRGQEGRQDLRTLPVRLKRQPAWISQWGSRKAPSYFWGVLLSQGVYVGQGFHPPCGPPLTGTLGQKW